MEAVVDALATHVATVCEAVAVVILAVAALSAVVRVARNWRAYSDLRLKKDIWLGFAASIVLALEFALAADIADTIVAPNWEEIGQLAAIAAIRTILNLFLERDLEAARAMRLEGEAATE
ncbi:DUF1622 domain-containing protein [Brevundimonas lenta]|uniref:Putative membrane protein n=1 Tax=Brevundimonas lenta TaxID=424796 RepID=A0A7W6JEU7_9CAUL|nr:DUF1622 domain-containing protein [Brevundimonas lenta]MBB4082842.1 putative membrane protein [Brevundimonas lenta]